MNNLYQGVKLLPIKVSDEVITKNVIKAIKEYFETTTEDATMYAKHKDEYEAYLDLHTNVTIDRDVKIITAYIEKEVLDLGGDEPWDFTVIDINQARRIEPTIQCGDDDNPVYCPVEFDLSLVQDQTIALIRQSLNKMVNNGINTLKNSRSSVRFTTYSIDEEPGVKMDNKILRELFDAMEILQKEVDIPDEVIIDKVKDAIFKTVKKYYEHDFNNKTVYFENKDAYEEYMRKHVKIQIDKEARTFNVYLEKEVVNLNGEKPWDFTVIDVNEANKINFSRNRYAIPVSCGTDENPVFFPVKINVSKLGRTAVNQAKQSIRGEIKDILRSRLINTFEHLEHCCITTTVVRVEQSQRRDGKGSGSDYNVILSYNGSEIVLYKNEQIPNEVFEVGQSVKVYVLEIGNKLKTNPYVKISRTHWDFIRKLFELEVPEIQEGIVEIKSIAREAGSRTKIAVCSNDPNVDPIGACIGEGNSRINAVRAELGGSKCMNYRYHNVRDSHMFDNVENVDIVEYSPDIEKFVANALSPAKVLNVTMDTETIIDNKTHAPKEITVCGVTVPEDQISLAIGNGGQNAKLAANLTKCKIDIKAEKKNAKKED